MGSRQAAGEKFEKIEFKDPFNDISKTCDELVKKISEALSEKSITNIKSQKEEAARFFAEYKYHIERKNFNLAEEYIETAAALAPDNPEYLYPRIYLRADKNDISHNYYKQMSLSALKIRMIIDSIKRGVALADDFSIKYPNYPEKVFYFSTYICTLIEEYKEKNPAMTPQLIKEMNELIIDLRPKHIKEEEKYIKNIDVNNIKSMTELFKIHTVYIHKTFEATKELITLPENQMQEEIFKTFKELLNQGADFVNKHPEFEKQISPRNIDSFILPFDELNSFLSEEQNTELLNIMKRHPYNIVKVMGYNFELNARLKKLNTSNPEILSKTLDGMYSELDNLPNIDNTLEKSNIIFPCIISRNFIKDRNLEAIYCEKMFQFFRKHGKLYKGPVIDQYLSFSNAQKLAKNIIAIEPEIQARKKELKKSNENINYSSITKELSCLKSHEAENAIKILSETALNVSLAIEKMANFSGSLQEVFYDKNNLYLLICTTDKTKILKFSMASNILSEECELPEIEGYKSLTNIVSRFYADDSYFLVGNKDEIFVVNRKNHQYTNIKKLPCPDIMSMGILNGRIYAFTGKMTKDFYNETTFFSCLPDGTDRKIHISTARINKENEFDKSAVFWVPRLFTDPKNNRILFLNTRYASCDINDPIGIGLFEFTPATNSSKKIISGFFQCGSKFDSNIYIYHAGNMLIFNTETNNIDFSAGANNYLLGFKPEFKSMRQCSCGFIKNGDLLWNGLILQSLSNNECSEIRILQTSYLRSTCIFPGIDKNSILLVASSEIFKITTNESSKGLARCIIAFSDKTKINMLAPLLTQEQKDSLIKIQNAQTPPK